MSTEDKAPEGDLIGGGYFKRYQRCANAIWELFPNDPLGDSSAHSTLERLEAIIVMGLLAPAARRALKLEVKLPPLYLSKNDYARFTCGNLKLVMKDGKWEVCDA